MRQIKPEWGAQRIKGLSISKAVLHALQSLVKSDSSIDQKGTETSLIGQFTYPKFGPGQLWEEMAAMIEAGGGEIKLNHKVSGITWKDGKITCVEVVGNGDGSREFFQADHVISTMPVRDLILAFDTDVPREVDEVAKGLIYRDFMTVGLLLKKMKIKNDTRAKTVNSIVPDNWIYVQEDDVKVGRLQIFNNWSPYMVKDENTVWIGLEYFCNEGDELWDMSDDDFKQFAIDELALIDIIDHEDVLDAVVIRVPKTYPAYFGSYHRFDTIRAFVDKIENLYLIGRNGMHRYNNMDHSMLTAMRAVDLIIEGSGEKESIWSVNEEEEYHESK